MAMDDVLCWFLLGSDISLWIFRWVDAICVCEIVGYVPCYFWHWEIHRCGYVIWIIFIEYLLFRITILLFVFEKTD